MKKILVIENDFDTLDIIGLLFKDSGFEVVESHRVLTIEEIVTLKPNVVVIDLLLDDAYASELCLTIKNHAMTNHIPVVLMSASHRIEQIAGDSCADAFIAKPFDIDHVEKIVTNLLFPNEKA